ncbi:hypothetical protein Bca52824_004195 [Brassica carinata]|uniref:Uncharacterized protein n=1 Tax=Brassica carinata TaxID=52824 RepID=A0A8X7WQ63_BRACI|nr:hypothetical protein Bca52824_004195 [Brassica carinata]
MGRMLQIWRGEWRKNDSQYWHFDPEPADFGLTLYMEEGESFANVEAIVRTHYGVSESTPMVLTYGLPDWMVVPSGHTPPLTIGSTTELVELMASRPWMVEFTLLLTLGAKGVAEYHFNRRPPFYIGSSSFVVDQTQDARAKASYERLVFGGRMVASESVMNEIFGEEEMVVFYRVAMEMELADKEKARKLEEQKGLGPCLICLDDDTEMEDGSKGVGREESAKGGGQGSQDKGKGIMQDSEGQTKAPAVLWDVGIDLLTFPEFCNRERAAAMEASENAFWESVLHEETKSTDETESTKGFSDSDEGGAGGLGSKRDGAIEKEGVVVVMGDDGASSTSNTAVICTQLGSKATSASVDVGVEVGTAVGVGNVSGIPLEDKGCQQLPPPSLMLTLAYGKTRQMWRQTLVRPSRVTSCRRERGWQEVSFPKCKIRSNNDDPKVLWNRVPVARLCGSVEGV